MARILVVDDENLVRYSLRITLESHDHTIAEATNGLEGIELQAQEPFDLAIIDIIMPLKGGVETIEYLRHKYPDLKIIAITGGGFEPRFEALQRALEMGADKALIKPFMTEQLIDCVNDCLGRSA